MTKSRKAAYLALLATSIIWGFAPPIIKFTLGFVSPLTFLFYRFLIVSIILFIPLCQKLKKLKPGRKEIGHYLLLGFLGTPLTLIILFEGIQRTSASDAAVLSIITPILVILGGVLFLREQVTFVEKIGVALAILGTLITIIQPLLANGLNIFENIFGNSLVFLGSVAWAAFTLLSKRIKLDPLLLTGSSFLVGLVVILPFTSFGPLNPIAIWGIFYMAILGSVVAYFTYIYGLSKIEASEATVFTYLQPLFAVPVAAIFLKEAITLPFLIGGGLILAGVFVSEML